MSVNLVFSIYYRGMYSIVTEKAGHTMLRPLGHLKRICSDVIRAFVDKEG